MFLSAKTFRKEPLNAVKQSEDFPLSCINRREIPPFGFKWETDEKLSSFLNTGQDRQKCFHTEKRRLCISFTHMQSIHFLPQQELLTGWSSMKRGRERERAGGKIDTERKAGNNREKERDADRLSSPPPLDNLGGEDTQTRRREHRTHASSSAARQPNHYVEWLFKLTWSMLCIVVTPADSELPAQDVTPCPLQHIARWKSSMLFCCKRFWLSLKKASEMTIIMLSRIHKSTVHVWIFKTCLKPA